jgi:hypothetical protein
MLSNSFYDDKVRDNIDKGDKLPLMDLRRIHAAYNPMYRAKKMTVWYILKIEICFYGIYNPLKSGTLILR